MALNTATQQVVAGSGLDNSSYVPTNISGQNLLSDTSSAYQCFTRQVFSGRLQTFLISYVTSISSYYSIYK